MNTKIVSQPVIPPHQRTEHFIGNSMQIIQLVIDGLADVDDLSRAMKLLGEYRERRKNQ